MSPIVTIYGREKNGDQQTNLFYEFIFDIFYGLAFIDPDKFRTSITGFVFEFDFSVMNLDRLAI